MALDRVFLRLPCLNSLLDAVTRFPYFSRFYDTRRARVVYFAIRIISGNMTIGNYIAARIMIRVLAVNGIA